MMKSKNDERMNKKIWHRREMKIYHINESGCVFRRTKARKVKIENYIRAQGPERISIIDCYA